MSERTDLSSFSFAPIMDYPKKMQQVDLSNGADEEKLEAIEWGAGGYNEKRKGMYLAPHFEGKRYIHMGIDIWADAGEPVYAFHDGKVAYAGDKDRQGDYGGTIVTVHELGDETLFALYGHLSKASPERVEAGDLITAGEKIGELGTKEENGGWIPHLHFQLSWKDPKEADMPGVVSDADHASALETYPDPKLVLGNLF